MWHGRRKQRKRRSGAQPVFAALHFFSSGKTRSLDQTDFNIPQHSVETVFENSTRLICELFVTLREIIWMDRAEQRVGEILKMRSRPTADLGRGTLHTFDEIEQDTVGLCHRLFMHIVRGLDRRNDHAVATKRPGGNGTPALMRVTSCISFCRLSCVSVERLQIKIILSRALEHLSALNHHPLDFI